MRWISLIYLYLIMCIDPVSAVIYNLFITEYSLEKMIMNKKIGIYSSIVNAASVLIFAVAMLIKADYLSYLVSMFIAFSFVPMVASFVYYSSSENKVAGFAALGFAIIYAVFILAVYYAQITAVHFGGLSAQAQNMLDYKQFGLFFSYDLLGYGIMALATFFAGLTIDAKNKNDRWLKALLMIHGIFFISSFVLPLLGVFSPTMEGGEWIGTAVLEFWCLYFIPIGVLSAIHFKNKVK